MDFLDPSKKRQHKIRLIIGYFLISIVIGLSTLILVYAAYGYGINTKTGQIIQNGLLFVDSKPGGADIYLNGNKQNSSTAARLVLSAGLYNLKIQKNGYKPWSRSFVLDEHTVARYVYPFLFPEKPYTLSLKTYAAAPAITTQTPDRRWLLVQSPEASTRGNLVFDEFDTSNLAKAPSQITLPSGVATPAESSSYKEIEWSTNNNQLLLQHDYPGGTEFLVFNRAKPEDSFNINKLFKADPTQVTLKNKKADQLYLFNKDSGSIQVADTGQGTVDAPLIKHVLAFKPYGNNIITYVTNQGAPAGKVVAKIWDTGKTYPLYTFNAGQNYLIDAAQFQGHWYYVAGSDTADRINVYKDPEDRIRDPRYGKALALVSLTDTGADKISFSDNARFIAAEAGQKFAVYDLETENSYHYTVSTALAGNLEWMDGHRLIGLSNGQVYIADYDNKNPQLISKSIFTGGAFFSRDYNQMIVPSPNQEGINLERIDLRAGVDLPPDRSQ